MKWLTSVLAVGFLGGVLSAAPEVKEAPRLKVAVKADMLALRATVTTNIQAPTWQWRVQPGGPDDQVAWSHCAAPGADGVLKLSTPMPAGGWYRLEVRALEGEKVLRVAGVNRPAPRPFEMVTAEGIAALPEAERPDWVAYVERSRLLAQTERDALAEECRSIRAPVSKPAPSGGGEFELPSKVDPAKFTGQDSITQAEVVLSYQTPSGGWSKAVDYTKGPRPRGTHWTTQSGDGWHYSGTLDNRSTTEQVRFLAWVHLATKRADFRKGVERGVEWILHAQFPNGGWPQVYPLEPGYHEAITLNDDAMLHALELLHAVSRGEEPFAFMDAGLKEKAAAAYERGLACVLAMQVRLQGKATVWCAQHHPLTLAPVAARLKEPPSLSGAESTSLLRFLMRQGPATAPYRTAIGDAITWLEEHRITGLRKTKTAEGKTDYLEDASSQEVLWARFYDLESGRPMFAGAQDGKVYTTFHEMAQHNKVAYDYFVTKPADLLAKEVPRWRKRLAKEGVLGE